jgi:hypothetical protein
MKVMLENTTRTVEINGVTARVWEGATESGIPVQAVIVRIAAPAAADLRQFEAELKECRDPSAVEAFPLRMIL